MSDSYGSALTSNPGSDERSGPQQGAPLGLALIALCILIAIGSFGTWWGVHVTSSCIGCVANESSVGIAQWRGPGWLTLVLAGVVLLATTLALAKQSAEFRLVAASFMYATLLVALYNVIQISYWLSFGPSATSFVGWGLWLCFASATLGAVIATAWLLLARPRPLLIQPVEPR